MIDTLAAHNIKGERREGRIGVWVQRPDKGALKEDKIAAIGVRVSKWVTFHGISLNVMPDLSHYDGIVPSIAGWARQTGLNTIYIDDRDPFAHGFSLV